MGPRNDRDKVASHRGDDTDTDGSDDVQLQSRHDEPDVGGEWREEESRTGSSPKVTTTEERRWSRN